jgi:hypothetical protein
MDMAGSSPPNRRIGTGGDSVSRKLVTKRRGFGTGEKEQRTKDPKDSKGT